jgi:hypothetical protein
MRRPRPVSRRRAGAPFIAKEPAMTAIREPRVTPVPISDLRPTQITVGMREVEAKRKRWREQQSKKAEEFLGRHMIPVVVGPGNRNYVIDHHHLARALHEEGVEEVLVAVVANLSKLKPDMFWFVLDCRDLMHPFDDEGKRRDHTEIPKTVAKLIDDPFRSLAGELRRAGGFAKDTTPFSEFLWAQFLRARLKRKDVERHFERSLDAAIDLARSKDADYLPGWCGPSDAD